VKQAGAETSHAPQRCHYSDGGDSLVTEYKQLHGWRKKNQCLLRWR